MENGSTKEVREMWNADIESNHDLLYKVTQTKEGKNWKHQH